MDEPRWSQAIRAIDLNRSIPSGICERMSHLVFQTHPNDV